MLNEFCGEIAATLGAEFFVFAWRYAVAAVAILGAVRLLVCRW